MIFKQNDVAFIFTSPTSTFHFICMVTFFRSAVCMFAVDLALADTKCALSLTRGSNVKSRKIPL